MIESSEKNQIAKVYYIKHETTESDKIISPPLLLQKMTVDVSEKLRHNTTNLTKSSQKIKSQPASVSGKYYCKYCRRSFRDEEAHESVIIQENSNRKYRCREHATCNNFFTKHELFKHLDDHGIEINIRRSVYLKQARHKKIRKCKNYEGDPCEICFELFPTKQILEDHYKNHEDQFLCEICKEGFKKVGDYVRHVQIHDEDKMFQCPICSLKRDRFYLIRNHIYNSHDQFKKFKCPTCDKRFNNFTTYKEHVNFFHSGQKNFICESCGLKFMYSYYLMSHKSVCSKSDENVSNRRKKRVRSKNQTKKTQEEEILCEICGKQFKTAKFLADHVRIHTGEMRYKCSYCNKMFYTKSRQKQHECVHTGEKPYSCSVCGKRYTQRNNLIIHGRSHTGERPYVCQFCDLGLISKSALVSHTKRCKGRADNNEYNCDARNNQLPLATAIREKFKLILKPLIEKPEDDDVVYFINEYEDRDDEESENDVSETESQNHLYIKCEYESDNLKTVKEENGSKNPTSNAKCFFCKYCRRNFPTEENHEESVNQEKKLYYCREHEICTEKYSKHGLLKHFEDHRIEVVTDRKFWKQRRSKNSRSKNVEGEPCEICFQIIGSDKELEEHYKVHDDQYLCEVCKSPFKLVADYVRHIHTHSDDKMFECPVCSLKKPTFHQLYTHMKNRHDQFKKYKCTLCEKRFPYYASYQEHVNFFHSGKKSFVCDVCGKQFTFASYLSTHKQNKHGESSISCTYCSQKFSTTRTMHQHITTKHMKTMHVCDICGKMVKVDTLNDHQRIHLGDKRHKCTYCDKMFVKKQARIEHERVHTKEKPYKCSHCGKGFTQKHSLSIHERLHTGERPYVCRICSKGFTSNTNLVNHMKTCKIFETTWQTPRLNNIGFRLTLLQQTTTIPHLVIMQHMNYPYKNIVKDGDHNRNITTKDITDELDIKPQLVQIKTEQVSDEEDDENNENVENNESSEETSEKDKKTEDLYNCKYCNKTYTNEKYHQQVIEKEERCYHCHDHIICTKIFTKHELLKHCEEHEIEIKKPSSYLLKARNKTSKNWSAEPCEICLEVIQTKQELKKHYEQHEDQFTCEFCNLGFKLAFEYVRHKRNHNEDKTYECPVCYQKEPYFPQLKAHMVKSHEQFRKYKCSMCNMRFAFVGNCQKHYKLMHSETNSSLSYSNDGKETRAMVNNSQQSTTKNSKTNKLFDCIVCQMTDLNEELHVRVMNQEKRIYYCQKHDDCKEKYTKHGLLKHVQEHGVKVENVRKYLKKSNSRKTHNLPVEPCEICLEVVGTKEDLEKHYENHEDQYLCEICRTGFKLVADYVRHLHSHSEDKMYECPVCSLKKARFIELITHMRNNHDQFKKYKCTICDKRFDCYGNCQNHMKYFHSEEKSFVCDICDQKFSFPNYLLAHKRKQHPKNIESHNCPHCSAVFKSVGVLNNHVARKHPKTTYVCDVCGKTFVMKCKLVQHTRTHTGEKKFKCPVCDKMFLEKIYLTKHERIHTGDKPYKCSECGKSFTNRANLEVHARYHTGERPFVCPICTKGFISKGALLNHSKYC